MHGQHVSDCTRSDRVLTTRGRGGEDRDRLPFGWLDSVISADVMISGMSPGMPGCGLVEWRDGWTSRDQAATVTAGQAIAGSAVVSVRRADQVVEDHPWSGAGVDLLAAAVPWRTFRWHDGQRHFSGTYWCSTQRDHVIYESRLELAVLLLADFDPSVTGVFAQPFLLRAEAVGVARKHIPDYLLLTGTGPVVVDVK